MFKSSLLVCAAFAVASAQPPSPFQSFSSSQPSSPFGGGSYSSSPFGGGSHSSSPFGGGSHSSSPFGGGSHSSSPFGGGSHSSSPFGGGPPSSSPFSFGPPQGRPGGPPPGGRPGGFPGPAGYKSRPNAPSKLFSWLGSAMGKLPGLVPKVQFHSKQKPGSSQKAPQTYFSGPPRESLILPQIPNSIYETGSSPFGDSSISFAPSHSGPIKHSAVNYRNPSGPPPSYSSRPGPPPSFGSRPSFSSRPPPSFSSGPPPPSYLSSSQYPSESPFSSSSNRYTSPSPQGGGNRDGLEVFPSRQVSYQSQTLSQNQAGYDDAINGLQNLYGSQSSNKPSYEQRGPTNYEQQQSSYSQSQPQISNQANYGAAFHNIEPVRVAPMFDIQNFRASAADMSGAASNSEQKQQGGNIHDTPFVDIVNQYSAHADAATASSDQMISAMGNSDMVTAASSNVIRGVQILGQGEGNPVFEVLAGPNAPTYDGHPVDLSKLISMIEPGAEIDTVPHYGDASMGAASEQQPVYAEAPSNIDLESEAAMSSGGFSMSGNKKLVSGLTQVDKDSILDNDDDDDDNDVHASASESRPTVVKPDGTRLTDDEKLIKEHFEQEIILDDNLQDDSDKGFIIVRMRPEDDETGHGIHDTNRTIDKDDLLAIVQQLRNSANFQLNPEELSVVDSLEIPNKLTEPETEENDFAPAPLPNTDNITTSSRHPNHNYNANSPNISLDSSRDLIDSSALSPVINPIFDSVRPNITASDESVRTLVVDDQDYPGDDDMIVETDGDLAASASRNVKSVAIIVTPPPYYVKIKNKYKKVNPPVSSLTSTASPPTSSVITPPLPPRIISGHQLINESSPSRNPKATNNNASNSSSSNRNNSSIPSAPTTIISPLQVNESNDSTSPSSGVAVSSISSGRTISNGVTNNNGTKESSTRQVAPRYPVYRGKTSV